MEDRRAQRNFDKIALEAAHKIEDIFWQGHQGGAAQAVSRIQNVVREAILEARLRERDERGFLKPPPVTGY